MNPEPPILAARGLSKSFSSSGTIARLLGRQRTLHAVRDVDLHVLPGETVSIVGESGCGKSTLGRTLVRLYSPTSGSVIYDGRDISDTPQARLRPIRRNIQMIFQDARSALNPRQNVEKSVRRVLATHGIVGEEAAARVRQSLTEAGLDPSRFLKRYPVELSGGEAQRVGIAKALAVGPRVIVADEPVSALDVTIQAQIIRLIRDIKERMGLSLVFISHDLAVVHSLGDRVYVMYLGMIMETGPTREVLKKPLHPYSEALVNAVPRGDHKPVGLRGALPSPSNPPAGCPFSTRCAKRIGSICDDVSPPPVEVEPGRTVSCHLYTNL